MDIKVVEDKEKGKVYVEGHEIDGFLDEKKCKKCNQFLIYHEKYDALFCSKCNSWVEEACSDATCIFCKGRPQSPLCT